MMLFEKSIISEPYSERTNGVILVIWGLRFSCQWRFKFSSGLWYHAVMW